MSKTRLYSYKMTHDNGFAPNPFHDILTLANCKPRMRINNQIGDWIAGFTSKTLTKNSEDKHSPKLIYLMQVTNKIRYDEYWNGCDYEKKKPIWKSLNLIERTGDNTYEPLNNNYHLTDENIFDYRDMKYRCLINPNHKKKEEWIHDLGGEFVLISNRFYYFGGKPIKIEKDRPKIPVYPAPKGYKTLGVDADKFIYFIESNFPKGINHMPHEWKNEIKGC